MAIKRRLPNVTAPDGVRDASYVVLPEPEIDPSLLETLIAGLLHRGWVVLHDAVPRYVVDDLRLDLERLDDADFGRAGVGRGDDWQRLDAVRRDRVHWLDPDRAATQWYFGWVETLRAGLNRGLLLGLFDYECHVAWYPPGAFYATHLDAFRGRGNRRVSTVLYLNADWQPTDGGELVIYEPVDAAFESGFDPEQRVANIVAPTGGTLVCFLSEEIPHEVLEAQRDRYSIAGWFRVRDAGAQPDPPIFAPTA